jgi:two-component system chemotaxis sensor kinase CheA
VATLTADQIRALFAQEAEVRLAHLDQLLLRLEHAPEDEELLRSIFRELHTLKGSSAAAGLDEVSRPAHELEELVDDVRAKRRQVTPELIDNLFAGADRLAKLVNGTAEPPRPPDGDVHQHAEVARRAPDAETPPVAEGMFPTGHPPHPARREAGPPTPTPGSGQAFAAPPGSAAGARPTSTDSGGVVMVQLERLDELVRLLGESAAAHLRVGRMLKERFGVDAASVSEYNELSRDLNILQDRVMRTRMVPLGTITDQLHRAVRDIARSEGKRVRWVVEGASTELDRGVLNQLSDSLLHLVRNAVDHGVEPPAERPGHKNPEATIRLHAWQLGSDVIIAVTDDGRGIDIDRVRERATRLGIDTADLTEDETLQLIFRSGLSTTSFVTDVSGRGVGLDVVKTSVEAARGRIEVRSELGKGTEFRIVVPITLAVLRCLVVEAVGQRFALPLHRVVVTQAHDASREIQAEGRAVVWVEDQPVTVSTLANTLGLGDAPSHGPIVVLTDSTRSNAFQVDRLVGQRDVVLKSLSRLLPPLPAVAGAGIEPDGSIFLVLDPPGLIQGARSSRRVPAPAAAVEHGEGPQRRILVVDDALTVRELQRSILERAGFDVRTASDGMQALTMLAAEPVDLVLTDVEMPNLDGFGLTEAIRGKPELANIPILILSSLSSEADRQRGLDVGADGYIVKSSFDEPGLLAAVNRLLGAAG